LSFCLAGLFSSALKGRRLLAWRGKRRCRAERVGRALVACRASRQATRGHCGCWRKAMVSSSGLSPVEAGCGPLVASCVVARRRHLARVFGVLPWRRARGCRLC